MGVIIDSCKRTFVCCESNDESGYKRVYPKYIESDSDIMMMKKIQKMKKKIKK